MTNAPGIEFSGLSANAHRCIGEVVGDWVIFRCPICEGYERRINWKTGEMQAAGQNEFHHYGSPNNSNNAAALLAMSGLN